MFAALSRKRALPRGIAEHGLVPACQLFYLGKGKEELEHPKTSFP